MRLSKSLSYVLRHGANKMGLQMNSGELWYLLSVWLVIRIVCTPTWEHPPCLLTKLCRYFVSFLVRGGWLLLLLEKKTNDSFISYSFDFFFFYHPCCLSVIMWPCPQMALYLWRNSSAVPLVFSGRCGASGGHRRQTAIQALQPPRGWSSSDTSQSGPLSAGRFGSEVMQRLQ